MKIINSGCCWVLLLFCCSAGLNAQDQRGVASSRLEVLPDAVAVASPFKPEYAKAMELTKPMTEALNKAVPSFVFWKISDYPPKQLAHYPYAANSLPYAVKGDFNGDGIIDVVVTGHDENSNITGVLLSSSTRHYSLIEVEKSFSYKTAREHGRKLDYKPAVLLVFKPKGFGVYFNETSDSQIYLQNDGFKFKRVYSFVRDSDKLTELSFIERLDGDPPIYVWDDKSRKFNTVYGGCDDRYDISATDPYYCF